VGHLVQPPLPDIHTDCSEREEGARELGHCRTPCSPSCPQQILSQPSPTNLGRVWAQESHHNVVLWRNSSHFTSFSCYIIPELVLTLAPTPVWSREGSVRPHPAHPCPSCPRASSAPYLDEHFFLVHGSDHLSHIGTLLLQQLQLLPQQAHCKERDISTRNRHPCPDPCQRWRGSTGHGGQEPPALQEGPGTESWVRKMREAKLYL